VEDCTELKAELQLLRNRVARLEDQQAVRALQFKYGYYMDKCLFGDIVELFAEDATLYFLNGIFKGKVAARRLYGGGTGRNGPVHGMLFEHTWSDSPLTSAGDRQVHGYASDEEGVRHASFALRRDFHDGSDPRSRIFIGIRQLRARKEACPLCPHEIRPGKVLRPPISFVAVLC
jgi:hypothetical protein